MTEQDHADQAILFLKRLALGSLKEGQAELATEIELCAHILFDLTREPEKPQWNLTAELPPIDWNSYVWVWNADTQKMGLGNVFQLSMLRSIFKHTHWMPTGLAEPEPPEVKK